VINGLTILSDTLQASLKGVKVNSCIFFETNRFASFDEFSFRQKPVLLALFVTDWSWYDSPVSLRGDHEH
jgi:hypothetical protein